MSFKRALSTQERVDLAVAAGHTKLVMEHIRIHNSQGEGTGQLSVHLSPGNTTHYIYLPDYAFAAIDCYLTSLGIPLEGDAPELPRQPAFRNVHARVPTLTMEYLQYVNHCHEQAAYFKEHLGKTLSGTLFDRLEFAASHATFAMIQEIIRKHPFEIHGAAMNYDDQEDVWLLKLSNGQVICRAEAVDAIPGADPYGFYRKNHTDDRSTGDVLNLEINELAERLQDKGLGLQ